LFLVFFKIADQPNLVQISRDYNNTERKEEEKDNIKIYFIFFANLIAKMAITNIWTVSNSSQNEMLVGQHIKKYLVHR